MKTCAVEHCDRERAPDAIVCRDHLGSLWANRLDRSPTGYVVREPEWLRRRRTIGLPAKDHTNAA